MSRPLGHSVMNQHQHMPMEGIGRNIGEIGRNVDKARIKRGECPTCGTKTHKVGMLGRKTPLTVEGLALYGRCLKCHPVEGYVEKPPDVPEIPMEIPIPDRPIDDSDVNSVVSGITLDYHLIKGERRWDGRRVSTEFDSDDDGTYDNQAAFENIPKYRPEPSVGGDADIFQPPGPGGANRRQSSPAIPSARDLRNDPMSRIESDFDKLGYSSASLKGAGVKPPKRRTSLARKRTSDPSGNRGNFKEEPLWSKPIEEKSGSSSSPSFPNVPSKNAYTNDDHGAKMNQQQQQPIPEIEFAPDEIAFGQRDIQYDTNYEEEKNEIVPPSEEFEAHAYRYDEANIASNKQQRLQNQEKKRATKEIVFNPVATAARRASVRRASVSDSEFTFKPTEQNAAQINSGPNISGQEIEFSGHGNVTKPPPPLQKEKKVPPREEFFVPASTDRQSQSPGRRVSPLRAQQSPGRRVSPLRAQQRIDDSLYENRMMHQMNGGRSRAPQADEFDGRSSSQDVRAFVGGRRGKPKADDDNDMPLQPLPRRRPDSDDTGDRPQMSHGRHNMQAISQNVPDRPPNHAPRNDTRPPYFEHRRVDGTEIMEGEDNLSIGEIPVIIDSLKMNGANPNVHEKAFVTLAELIKQSDQEAKRLIVDNNGIQMVVSAMWENMSDVAVQSSAVQLLFLLSASSDGDPNSDALTERNAEGAVDALLIIMQTHNSIEDIQRNGCGTLACLAASSKNNRNVNDGTLSGAVLCVVNAMDAHRTSPPVQTWGIRALHNQCVYSFNADSNRTSLLESGYDGGGLDVITRAMTTVHSDMTTLEWACKLYWCLTSKKNVASALALNPRPLQCILEAIRDFNDNPEAVYLIQSAYGALANLAKLSDLTHSHLNEAGVVSDTISSMRFFSQKQGLNIEACALLANLAVSPDTNDEIIRAGGIDVIFSLFETFPGCEELMSEAFRALLCLCIESDEAISFLSSNECVSIISSVLILNMHSIDVLCQGCGLVASLSSQPATVQSLVSEGAAEAITKGMTKFSTDRLVQEAACMALRGIASFIENTHDMIKFGAAEAIIQAMQAYQSSVALQVNSCCALWNLCTKTQEQSRDSILDVLEKDGAIKCIVKAMQDHSDSGELQEMACGALWSIVSISESMKAEAVSSGGIDAVKCVFWMHPNQPKALEKACGVLSSVSVESHFAEAIASSEGITTVVEAMRSNNSNVALLELGCLLLRNLVINNSEYSEEASSAIVTTIHSMKENSDAAGFVREACDMLAAMACQSEACRNKMNNDGGVEVLMSTMDSGAEAEVVDAARAAFNQLTTRGG